MAIVIREYDKIAFDDRGHPVALAVEPGKKRTLTSGTAVKLLKDTVVVRIDCTNGGTWDVNTQAAVDSTSSGAFCYAGAATWVHVRQHTNMYLEVTET